MSETISKPFPAEPPLVAPMRTFDAEPPVVKTPPATKPKKPVAAPNTHAAKTVADELRKQWDDDHSEDAIRTKAELAFDAAEAARKEKFIEQYTRENFYPGRMRNPYDGVSDAELYRKSLTYEMRLEGLLAAGQDDPQCWAEAMLVFAYRNKGIATVDQLKALLADYMDVEGDAKIMSRKIDGFVCAQGSEAFITALRASGLHVNRSHQCGMVVGSEEIPRNVNLPTLPIGSHRPTRNILAPELPNDYPPNEY